MKAKGCAQVKKLLAREDAKRAEENARRTLIPESLMDQILAVGGKLLQLQTNISEVWSHFA